MIRVWDAPEPKQSTDRLMLLALADNANDKGYCWPSIDTMRVRCGLHSRRGARKVLERLAVAGYIERITRPGRSNVYRLSAKKLSVPDEEGEEPAFPGGRNQRSGVGRNGGSQGGGTGVPEGEERGFRRGKNGGSGGGGTPVPPEPK